MDEQSLLSELERLLQDLAINVRYEVGDFQGGMYRYNETRQMVINKHLSPRKKIKIMAQEIKAQLDLDSHYVVPALREVIENADRLE